MTGDVTALAAGGCTTSADKIEADRPDVTNSSLVVPYGSLQVENDVNWTARRGSDIIDGSNTRLRLGIARCTEVLLDVPDYFYSLSRPGASGFSDAVVSAKRQFGLLPGDFNPSVTAGLALPTSAENVSGRGYDPYIQIPWSRELSEHWSLSGMFTVTWFTSEPTQNPTFEQTFAVERLLGYLANAFIEYVGEYDHERPSQILDGGAVYRLTRTQQLDLRAGFGLSSNSPDHFFSAGYSFRFDRLF